MSFTFYSKRSLIGQQAVDQLANEGTTQISQQAVDQFTSTSTNVSPVPCTLIPWGQNILIFTKSKSLEEAIFYVQQTIQNGWSRSALTKQIKDNLYHKQGASPNNFKTTLPDLQSAKATGMTRDPYNFDFAAAALRDGYKEKELEDALTKNITDFLIELGQGFAYMGRQIKLTVARYSLESSAHPIGISEYELANLIPEDYKSALPSVKEIEEELNNTEEEKL
jgi:predicted nuclease of restriction endonuclease-like (RecB) superfamily